MTEYDYNSTRILVVADDTLARSGLAAELSGVPGMTVVAKMPSLDVAAAIEAYKPDAVVWDVGRDSAAGLSGIVGLVGEGPPIVLLVQRESGMPGFAGLGATGLVYRDAAAERIAAAVVAAMQGLVVIEPELSASLSGAPPASTRDGETGGLTPREMQVLRLVADGSSNKSIAYDLDISEHTVKFHVNSIMSKLGVHSRTEAVMNATRSGLLPL